MISTRIGKPVLIMDLKVSRVKHTSIWADRECHFVKSIQIWSFFWSIFSNIRTEYGEILCGQMRTYLSVFSPNAGKYRPEKTPYLDTFHAVGGCRLLSSTNFQIFKTFSSFLRSRASGLLMFSGVSIEISGMKWFNRVYNTRYKVPLYL